MDILGLTNAGASPALEATIRFAGQRQRLIAHNIANIETPFFQQRDVSPTAFQRELGRAIDLRNRAGGTGSLDLSRSREVHQAPDGTFTLSPSTPSGNIMFHDRNNRDVERLMQDQTENLAVFRMATDLLRTRTETLRSALAQRV